MIERKGTSMDSHTSCASTGPVGSGRPARVGIIGGGLLGMALGYRLSRQGAQVEVLDAADQLGGVLRTTELGGYRVDDYYHTILNTDENLLALIDEVGLGGKTRFTHTSSGFYSGGTFYPINTPMDLLRFKPLTLWERLRLGAGSQLCRLHKDWRKLDRVPVRDYLVRYCGKGGFEKFWRHLLRCKYDGQFDTIPATAIWARIKRMSPSKGKKIAWVGFGHLEGGYRTLVDTLAEHIRLAGGHARVGALVEQVVVENDRVTGLVVNGRFEPYDVVVSTVAYPLLARMLPPTCSTYASTLAGQQYMGSICVTLVMKRRLSPYHCIYLLDERVPFTGVIETTHYIDPAQVGGRHLVYLSKYFAPGSAYRTMDLDAVRGEFTDTFCRMFPDVERADIEHVLVAREPFVDPIRSTTGEGYLPTRVDDAPVGGLLVANNSQIYPRLPCAESVAEFSREIVPDVMAACRQRVGSTETQERVVA